MLTMFLTKYSPLILQLTTPLWGSEKSHCSAFLATVMLKVSGANFVSHFLFYFALLSLCSGCNMDLSHDSTLAFALQGNLTGKYPGNMMFLQFISGNTEGKKQHTH